MFVRDQCLLETKCFLEISVYWRQSACYRSMFIRDKVLIRDQCLLETKCLLEINVY